MQEQFDRTVTLIVRDGERVFHATRMPYTDALLFKIMWEQTRLDDDREVVIQE